MLKAETKKTIFTLFQKYWQEREISERQHFSISGSSKHNQKQQKIHLSQGASYLKKWMVPSEHHYAMEQEETIYQDLKIGITPSEAVLFERVIDRLFFCHAHNKWYHHIPLKSIRLREQQGEEVYSRRTPPEQGRDRMIYWTVGINRHIVSPAHQKPGTQLIMVSVKKLAETNPKAMALFYLSPRITDFLYANHLNPVYLGNTKIQIEFEPRNRTIIYTFQRPNATFRRVFHHDEFVFSGADILAAIAYRLIELLRFVDNTFREEFLESQSEETEESIKRLKTVMTALLPGWSVLEAKVSLQFDHSCTFYKRTLSKPYYNNRLKESIQKSSDPHQIDYLEKIINGGFVASGHIPFDLQQLAVEILVSPMPSRIIAFAKTLFPDPDDDSVQYSLDIHSPHLFSVLLEYLSLNLVQKYEVFSYFINNGFNPSPHMLSYLALIIKQHNKKPEPLLEKMLDTLLEFPFAVKSKYREPLGICLQSPLHKVWDALIKNGLKINYYYKNRELARDKLLTPLDFAIHLKDEVLIDRLLKLNADVSLIKSSPENELVRKLTKPNHDSTWRDRAVVIVVTGKFKADPFVILGNRRFSEHRDNFFISQQNLSLPGVYVEPEEMLLDAALRGLRTETAISLDLRNKNINYRILPPIDVNGIKVSFVQFDVQTELHYVKPWPGSHLINPKKVYWRRNKDNPNLVDWPKVTIRYSNKMVIEMMLRYEKISDDWLEKLGAILEMEENPHDLLLQYSRTLCVTSKKIKENPSNLELELLENKYSSIVNRMKEVISFLNPEASFSEEIRILMQLQIIEVLNVLHEEGFFPKPIPKKFITELFELKSYTTLEWIAQREVAVDYDYSDSELEAMENDPQCKEIVAYLERGFSEASQRWKF